VDDEVGTLGELSQPSAIAFRGSRVAVHRLEHFAASAATNREACQDRAVRGNDENELITRFGCATALRGACETRGSILGQTMSGLHDEFFANANAG